MTLEKYLAKHGITQQDFAESIGVGQSHVSRMLSGKVCLSFNVLRKISQVTGGKVTANDFLAPVAMGESETAE